MNSKYFLFAALGLCAFIFFAFYFSDAEDTRKSTGLAEKSATAPSDIAAINKLAISDLKTAQAVVVPEKKKDFRYIQDRLNAMQGRRPDVTFDPEAVAAAIERDVAWAPLKEIPKELPLAPDQFTDGREFIVLDGLKIETLMPGDRIRIPIQALRKEYDVVIDSVEKHDDKNISWNGHIESNDGQTHSATFTRGIGFTAGGMDTPDGSYELQVHGDKGWIAASGLLFKHPDPNTFPEPALDYQDDSTYTH